MFIVFLLSAAAVGAADSVVLGRASSNERMSYVENTCPEDAICLHSWFKWVIDVAKTVSGPSIQPGRIVTARMQHTSMIPSYRKRLRLFVLKPIDDPEERKMLRAEYYLEEMSEPHQMFCFLENPEGFGLQTEETYIGTNDVRKHCFKVPETGR